MKKIRMALFGGTASLLLLTSAAMADDACVDCHGKISPGQVQDWKASKHFTQDITCATCHGTEHQTAEDAKKAKLPDEHVCAECHEKQFTEFADRKSVV